MVRAYGVVSSWSSVIIFVVELRAGKTNTTKIHHTAKEYTRALRETARGTLLIRGAKRARLGRCAECVLATTSWTP